MVLTTKGLGYAPHISRLILKYRPEFGPGTPASHSNILDMDAVEEREAVEEFFNTATLSGNKITATVSGTEFELTEELVAESLRLPTDGQDAVLDLELTTFEAACQILSATKEEPVKVSGKKATLRPEYIPLCDIFTKSVQARGGNYNSLTKAKIEMLVGLIQEEGEDTSPNNTGATSPEHAEAGGDSSEKDEATPEDDQKKADIIARRILEHIELRVQTVGELYREWHEYRFSKLYKHMFPGLTDEQCFRRLKEIEETVMSLTNAETLNEALDRCTIVRPRARLQKLTGRIRKIKERYIEGTPEANLQLLALERLEIAKGEFAGEIDRLEVVCRQRERPHSPAPETDDGQNHGATPPRADPVTNETDERIEAPLTEQPGVSESGITEERAKLNADIAVVEANARAAKEVQDALNEEARREKEPPRLSGEEITERERLTAAKYPDLAKSTAVQAAKEPERFNAQKQGLEGFATAHKKKKTTAPSSSVPEKRKRKTSKKAQVAGLLERVTDTVIENQPDPDIHTEEEDEEHLAERSTRQRVSNTASQPQPVKRKRTKDMMANFNFSDSE
ncbi:uncharacterized abhydrolase domain-containing protein DDB_G0269086-like [Impatiens glandulifera]|uniref:uncharacterized abhydrolase domain-containing protein DDB_G0269086-like n=1 Tax=Impatiens glandulifera TaxID=253017 RepID=UPI001FB19821|nr:uncharacterized abhydrolase domain-containing protein DDB_G0269086-like [Impatiens glandulifera]